MDGGQLHRYLEWSNPLAIAHRGGANEFPENTLPAFQHAVDLGFIYLETDVHATKDGVLVAFHDADLSRTCGVDKRIDEMQWSEVQRARVHGVESIPSLDDLVEAFPQQRFNIDCKADSAVDALVAAIGRHNLLDRCCIGSFSDRRLRALRQRLGKRLCTSMGRLEVAWWRMTGRTFGANCAQVPVSVGPLNVVTAASVNRSRVPVHVWTVDEPAEIERLVDLGVDGIMTDRPAALKTVYSERGWKI